MNKKTIAPTPSQPIARIHAGQPGAEANAAILASEYGLRTHALASYDGDEE